MYFSFTIKAMRIIISILLIIFFVLLIMNYRYISLPSHTNDMEFKVVIDPGHGSIDTGTSYGNILEKEINLEIAKLLYEDLKKINIIPIMTRTEDKLYQDSRNKDIKQRPIIANNSQADLFISIHVNNFPSSQPSGSQIFFKSNSEKSEKLAEYVQNELVKLREENNRSLKIGDYYVLNNLNCPGILIEVGFISNQKDRELLSNTNYQKQLSNAIKDGIIQYFQDNFSKYKEENEEQNTEEVYKVLTNNETNRIYYISTTDNQISLIKNKLTFPVANFFNEKYSVLNFQEIMAISAVEQLLEPPNGLISPFVEGSKLNSLEIKDNIAILDLSLETASNFNGGVEMESYSVNAITKTILSVNGINGLKILINGKEDQSLGGHIIFDKIFYQEI